MASEESPSDLSMCFRYHRRPLPEHIGCWFEYAWRCESEGKLEDACDAYRHAVAAGESAEAHFNLANVLRDLKCDDEAAVHYKAAVQIDPAFCQAWYNLADLAEDRGDHAKALRFLQHAVLADPCFADAHFNLARCYEILKRWSNAAQHWAQYLWLDPCSEWAFEAREALKQCRRRLTCG